MECLQRSRAEGGSYAVDAARPAVRADWRAEPRRPGSGRRSGRRSDVHAHLQSFWLKPIVKFAAVSVPALVGDKFYDTL